MDPRVTQEEICFHSCVSTSQGLFPEDGLQDSLWVLPLPGKQTPVCVHPSTEDPRLIKILMMQSFHDSKCYAFYVVVFTIDSTGARVFDFLFAHRIDFRAFVYIIFA